MRNLVAIALLLSGCVTHADDPTRWSSADVVGYTLTLESKTAVESYGFGKEGYAGCDFGTVGGPIVGPALMWWIDEDGTLKLGEDRSKVWVSLRKRGHVGHTVKAESEGEIVIYRREAFPLGTDKPVIHVDK